MLSSTSGPLPAHSTSYFPAGKCLPLTVTVSPTFNVPLFEGPAMAADASNKENASKLADSFDCFIRAFSFYPHPGEMMQEHPFPRGSAWFVFVTFDGKKIPRVICSASQRMA